LFVSTKNANCENRRAAGDLKHAPGFRESKYQNQKRYTTIHKRHPENEIIFSGRLSRSELTIG
jgi:hypothetical protein